MSTYSESYWQRREEADGERERSPLSLLDKRGEVEEATSARTTAAPAVVDDTPQLWDSEIGDSVPSLAGKPTLGPVEPPPPTPPEIAPTPPAPPSGEFAPYSPSKPEAPATDDTKAQRLEAIRRIRELGDAPMEAPEGLRDADLAAAARRDKQSVQRANLSETIRAAFARQAPRLQQEPSESAGLLQRRHMADAKAGQNLARKMTAEEKIAAVLRGEKVEGMTPYQVEQIKRNAVLDAQRREDKEAADKRHAEERDENLKWRETVHKDALANAAATRALAARGIDEKNRDQVSNDAKDLGAKLGDTAVFEARFQKLQKLIKDNGGELPGLGIIEGVRQQPGVVGALVRKVSPPSQAAIEGRKTLRQLAADYAREISGAGVSDKERSVLNQATIDVENDDSGIAMAGLESLREMYEAKAAQIKKGYRPEAVQQVEAGRVAPTPIKAPEPKRVPPKGLPPNALWHKGAWWYEDGGVMVRHAEKPQ